MGQAVCHWSVARCLYTELIRNYCAIKIKLLSQRLTGITITLGLRLNFCLLFFRHHFHKCEQIATAFDTQNGVAKVYL